LKNLRSMSLARKMGASTWRKFLNAGKLPTFRTILFSAYWVRFALDSGEEEEDG
jgi:hypothetical protein